MKYKKLLVLITCLLFFTVAVFCFAQAFKITDVTLSSNTVEGSSEGLSSKCEEVLKKYEGKNLIFLNESEVKSELNSLSGYIEVVSVKKEFPNKLSVKISERLEAFAIKNGNDYFVVDVDFNVLAKKSDVFNNVDGTENILLNLSLSDYSDDLKVCSVLNVYDGKTATYLKNISSVLYSYRKDLASVTVTVKKDGREHKTLTLKMKEGVEFTIFKADQSTLQKLTATYQFYTALENKGVGEYITVLEDNGNITIKQ